MPTALTTSKRKFHTLLDSLTSRPSSRSSAASTTSKASTAAEQHPKRPRLSPRSSIVSSHPLSEPSNLRTISRAATPKEGESTIRVNARTASILKRKEEERRVQLNEQAQYNPWSADGFLRRLKTFSDLTVWTPGKADEINEVVWAKRGWSCDGVNRVACKKGCEARVVVALRPKRKDAEGNEIEGSEDFSEEVSDELVKRYEALVLEGHNEGCLWRVGRDCADDIYRIGVVRGEQWQRELRERYHGFDVLGEKNKMPAKGRLEYPVDVEQTARYLEDDYFDIPGPLNPIPMHEPDDRPSINHSSLALALTGWTLLDPTSTTNPTATCSHCFRRVGLWMYTQPSHDEADPMKLDLINSHRHYCPWISGASQAMPNGTFEDLPAYEVLERVISGWAGMRARARKSGARPARRLSMNLAENGQAAVTGTGANEQGRESEAEQNGSRPTSAKSREQIREEDTKRFARLRELTRMMGLKKLRRRPQSTTTVPSAMSIEAAAEPAQSEPRTTTPPPTAVMAQAP